MPSNVVIDVVVFISAAMTYSNLQFNVVMDVVVIMPAELTYLTLPLKKTRNFRDWRVCQVAACTL